MPRKFRKLRGQRISFLKNMENNLIMKERVQTTDARARELRPLVEKLVTLAKKQNLASLRLLLARLPKEAAMKLYYEIAPKYQARSGGYLRIGKMSVRRKRDAANQAVIEFV